MESLDKLQNFERRLDNKQFLQRKREGFCEISEEIREIFSNKREFLRKFATIHDNGPSFNKTCEKHVFLNNPQQDHQALSAEREILEKTADFRGKNAKNLENTLIFSSFDRSITIIGRYCRSLPSWYARPDS